MKFSLTKVTNGGCRLGMITEAGRHGNKTFTTPMCMVYTKKGSAPYLTSDMLSQITSLPSCVHMPLNLLIEHKGQISKYGQGLGHYTALQQHLVYTTLHDPAIVLPSGYNGKKNVVVWGKGGKITLDTAVYMEFQKACQPDWFHALADGDTNVDTTRKKAAKIVDKTLRFLDQCIELKNKHENLEKSQIFGVIEGGYDDDERCRSARETAQRNVAGFVLDGFHHNGPNTEKFDFSSINHILQKVWNCIPEEKPRLMSCVWTPLSVLDAVQCGIDIFDSCYPYVVTERNAALVFDYKTSTDVEQMGDGGHVISGEKSFEMDFSNEKFREDFSPILSNCGCFTCTNHTRAYLHHLVNTSELLAGVLLMIHNFHHYFGFFEAIRQSLKDETFSQLKKKIESQVLR